MDIRRFFKRKRTCDELLSGDPHQQPSETCCNAGAGVFHDLLDLRVVAGDAPLREHFASAAGNAKYTSAQVQNEIVSICGNMLKEEIVSEANRAVAFSVLADETADIGGTEQLSIGVRFIDKAGDEACVQRWIHKHPETAPTATIQHTQTKRARQICLAGTPITVEDRLGAAVLRSLTKTVCPPPAGVLNGICSRDLCEPFPYYSLIADLNFRLRGQSLPLVIS
ncbi:hypothetical protein HPB47_001686 [Ixodes persulcatus]|uniref:Uncharacterized protein n=1 Tax=Ixodes persulcatus TaxID=34615 RepID=A0AC60PNB2_IXOPE|nr:hypothetical protein HPB47_001686 [Ixodes persulcatus]